MADSENHHIKSLADKARSALSNVEQDDRFKQAAATTRDVAARAEQASKNVSRKVAQEDAWDELRSDIAVLTEIVRAHHALIIDLIDHADEHDQQTGTEPDTGHGG